MSVTSNKILLPSKPVCSSLFGYIDNLSCDKLAIGLRKFLKAATAGYEFICEALLKRLLGERSLRRVRAFLKSKGLWETSTRRGPDGQLTSFFVVDLTKLAAALPKRMVSAASSKLLAAASASAYAAHKGFKNKFLHRRDVSSRVNLIEPAEGRSSKDVSPSAGVPLVSSSDDPWKRQRVSQSLGLDWRHPVTGSTYRADQWDEFGPESDISF